ncbi:MAG TPA: hypothetical protein PKZ61_12570 [Thermoflexales bacterium]|nr:hypothetical protein [Thermoflexales bacterium]
MPQISVSTIHVIKGTEFGDAAQVIAQESGRRAARPGETLVVFMDFPGASPDALAEIGGAACDAYWRAPGSQTAALRAAITRASDSVLTLNRGAVTRLEGSLTCVAADAGKVVIAQAGPALAFARGRAGAFERIEPARLQSPIGAARTEDVEFSNFPWQPGDAFVISGSYSCRDVNDQLINRCMGKGEARLIAGYLNANVKQGSLTGVALTLTDTVTYGTPVAPAAVAPATIAPRATAAALAPAAASSRSASAPSPLSSLASGAQVVLGRVGGALGFGLGKAGGAARKTLGEVAASMLPEAPRAIDAAERSRAAMIGLRAATILLPIAVAVIVTILYMNLSGQAERIQLQDLAKAQIAQASADGLDPNAQRSAVQRALDTIAAFNAKAPGDKTFDRPQAELSARLDQLRRITRIQVTGVYEFAAASDERRVSASTLGAFVMDRANGTVDHLVRNAGRPTADALQLILPQQPNGPQLRDVAWASSVGDRWRTEGAVLFGAETGFEYKAAENQTGLIRWPAGLISGTSQIVAGELWNGNLYALDAGVGQIWRLTRQSDGAFASSPYFRVPYGPLTTTIDIAVDGAVYVLQRNGIVLKYLTSAPATFAVSPPEPIGRSVAIALSAQEQQRGSVFLADVDNGAIWQLGKNGEFQRQYRPPGLEFANMIDMSIDPVNNLVYVLTNKKLLSFKYVT